MSATVNDLLFAAMADATRKLADALGEYQRERELERLAEEGRGYQKLALSMTDPAHHHLITATTDRDILETLQGQADELLHAIDVARLNVQGAIPLQTLDLVRGKVKDVLANLAGTIEKDM